MRWKLSVAPAAAKQLSKIDRQTADLIIAWLRKHIDGCENPRAHGKPLTGNLAGAWRYRVGTYRVLCELQDDELVVLAFEVAHRNKVYRKQTRTRKRR